MNKESSFQDAYNFAKEKHKGQTRGKNHKPYFNHIKGIIKFILDNKKYYGENFDLDFLLNLACLHDVVEDCNISEECLKTQFGEKVATGVCSLSKNKDLAKSNQLKDSLNRIKEQPKEVWVVKMLDRMNNISSLNLLWNCDKHKEYLLGTNLIFEELQSADEFTANNLKKQRDKYLLKINKRWKNDLL